jgi:hypothetical protein
MSIVPMNSFEIAQASDAYSEIGNAGDAVEVTVMWGDNVLLHKHLSPPRSFSLDEGKALTLPVEILGALEQTLVEVEGGRAFIVVPNHASGEYARKGGTLKLDPVQHADNIPSARKLEVTGSESVSFRLGAFTVHAAHTSAIKALPSNFLQSMKNAALQHVGLSFVLHAAVIGSVAFLMPRMGADDAEGANREQLLMMQKMISMAAAHEAEKVEEMPSSAQADQSGGAGARAANEEGKMGSSVSKNTSGRWQQQGPKDNPNPMLSRKEALAEAREFGLVSLLGGIADPNAPTAAWAPDNAQGRDSQSFNGHMWDTDIGEAAGGNGLGLFGTGEGGGGKSNSVGLGAIGTYGHGAGDCTEGDCAGFGPGNGNKWGRGSSPLNGGHVTKVPTMREQVTTVNGTLRADVIQRVVRQNFGRFRGCYDTALRSNPSLTGRVAVKFVIGRDGAVANSGDGGSDIPDQTVISCVTRSFSNLSFPAPEGGLVTVTYPILFTPGS